MQKFTPLEKFTLMPGKTGGTNLTSVFNVSLLYFRKRTAGYWVGNCKEVFLQRGDVQFLILPPLVNISHCLETLALGEHFVLILLFRGIINIKSDMTHLTSCKQNQKNGGKSRNLALITSHSDSDPVSFRSLFITRYKKKLWKVFLFSKHRAKKSDFNNQLYGSST